mgnify:CR=1 FL=1
MSKIIKLILLFLYLIPFTIVFEKEYQLTYLSLLFLFSAFYFGNIILKSGSLKPVDYSNFMVSNNSLLFISFTLYILFKNELVFNVFTHLFSGDLVEWSLENAVSRYNGYEENPGMFYNLGTLCMFLYAMLLGTIEKRKYYFLFIVGLLFIFLIESSTLGRAGTFAALIALFSELLIRKNKVIQNLSNLKFVKIGIVIFLLFSFVFLYSAINRLDADDDVFMVLQIKIGEYLIGPYQAFFVWHNNFTFEDQVQKPLFNLFTAVYKLTGSMVKQGSYNLIKTDYGYTNIFTIMRALYADLGFFFSFVLFFLYGLFIKYFTFKRMNYFEYFFVRIALNIFLMVILSPFNFSTFLLATIISFILLFLTNNRKGSNLLKKQINISKNI